MQAAQTIGIDLPLKALVWQDGNGVVWVGFSGNLSVTDTVEPPPELIEYQPAGSLPRPHPFRPALEPGAPGAAQRTHRPEASASPAG
jgi:hypothetical protein